MCKIVDLKNITVGDVVNHFSSESVKGYTLKFTPNEVGFSTKSGNGYTIMDKIIIATDNQKSFNNTVRNTNIMVPYKEMDRILKQFGVPWVTADLVNVFSQVAFIAKNPRTGLPEINHAALLLKR